jgi:endo-1,4-beta-xylanase
MPSRSHLLFGIATTAFALHGLGCTTPDSAAPITPPTTAVGAGGSAPVGSGGVTETGGSSATGGVEGSGGTTGSGGSTGTASSGGEAGSGGETGTGGTSETGGETGTGGRTGTGGVTGTGGDTTGTGGATGEGGTAGDGGTLATGGRSGRGGTTGTAGRTGTGGATGAGGSTGPVTLPGKFVGNIDTRNQIRSDFKTYWDQFSPENAGKWSSVQGSSQSSFNWNSLDAMYKYCTDNNIVFKEHTFVWGSQQPGWTSSLTTSNGPTAVQNWMNEFCKRYPNVALIDVVNEPPPHTTPAYANAIGGGTNSTWDWIANAFKWARAACPNAVLILNDYNNSELSGDAKHTIDIVTAIKKLGAPIDAVGCQTHGASNLGSSTLKTNIDNIAKTLGLPVYVTEYDIGIADDNQQKAKYQDHFTMFMSNDNIKGVTVWGYIVGATWRSNTGIMQSDGTMRPAMTWLMDFLGR